MQADTYRYLVQANEFTAFYKRLALILQPFLNKDWDLADIGCGPAFIDYELLGMVRSVTVIDDNAAARAFVQETVSRELKAGNFEYERITPLDFSSTELEGREWDVALFSFYGGATECLEPVIAGARRRAVIFVYDRPPGEFFNLTEERAQAEAASDVEAFLTERALEYHKTKVELQFGQPFRSIEDIHGFLKAQAACAGANDTDPVEQAMRIEERIIKTGRYDYPYYFPRNISVTIFIVLKPV